MSKKERASLAAKAVHARRSTEERSKAGAHAYLAGAVNTVTRRWSELTDDQKAGVRAVACSH